MTDGARAAAPLARAAEHAALAAMCAFAFLLPFQGIGAWRLADLARHHPGDWIAVAALPALALVAWRRRAQLAANRVVLAWAAFGAARIVAAPFTDDPRLELGSMARDALAIAVVGGIAALAADERGRGARVRWFLAGGLVAVVAALGGYAFLVLAGRVADGVNPFVYRGVNPIFDGWPRLAGTFAHSPQHMGEYLVVLFGLALAGCGGGDPARRRLRAAALGAVGLALLLTFSFAWVGGLVVLAGWWALRRPRSRGARLVAAGGVALVLLAAVWITNVGLPDAEVAARAGRFGSCARLDLEHGVTRVTRAEPHRCRPVAISWPYAAPLTLYLEAKETALRLFLEHPLAGTGRARYAAAAERRHAAATAGVTTSRYYSPHCAYLEAFATSGVCGGLALLAVVLALATAWRPSPPGAPPADLLRLGAWAAAVALFCIGVNIDVAAQGHLWFVLGLAGATRACPAPPRGATGLRAEGDTAGRGARTEP